MRSWTALLTLCLCSSPAWSEAPGATPAAPGATPAPGPPGETPVTTPRQTERPPGETPVTHPHQTERPPSETPVTEPQQPERPPSETPVTEPDPDEPVANDRPPGETPTTTPATANGLTAISIASLPERCKAQGERAVVPNRMQALPARISLASCLADVAVAPLPLIDAQASILDVDDAIAPSLALLDEVTAAGDPALAVMALHAKAQLYASMTSRMQTTVPPPLDATPEALALRDSRRQILQSMLQPWREQQLDAHRAIVELATKNPALARHPVARTAIRDSQQELARAQVATVP